MHNLALSHKKGRGSDILDPKGLIAKLRVTDYVERQSVKLYFATVNSDGVVIDERNYSLSGGKKIKPFSELKGYAGHNEDLELSIGGKHNWPGFSLRYNVADCLEVVRTDAKNKQKKKIA